MIETSPSQSAFPRWIREYRIKEWEWFTAQNDLFMLEVMFCNLKLYRMAQVLFYDKDKGEKFIFRKIIPGAGWQLPHDFANSSMDSHSSGFFFRIHSWLDVDIISLDINIEKTKRHPPLTVHLAYNIDSHSAPVAVSLKFDEKRMMSAYKAHAPIRGDVVFNGRHISLKQEACSGFFCNYKGYFPYPIMAIICNSTGFDSKNRRFGFHIAENQTRESNKNNENALWVDGRLTHLPIIRITMPAGPDGTWVIQDVEGMVDLTFTPKEPNRNVTGFLFTYVEFTAPLGHYNGILVDAEGEKIQVRNLYGMAEKIYLRV